MTTSESPTWLHGLTDRLEKDPTTTSFVDEEVIVALTIGKSAHNLRVVNGTVSAACDAEADVRIPLTNKQLDALLDGSLSLSEAYMRGDIKPEGSSRALLLAVETFDGLARR